MKINVSMRTQKGIKNKIKKDIIKSIEGNSGMRREIRRVFQMANRRIENIEKSGAFSPAVAALGKGDVKGYSKFSVKGFGNTGSSWQALKKEYAKCIAFLNQPTSTASGARDFERQVKSQMGIDDDLWQALRDDIMGGYNSVSGQLLNALPYSQFMQEVYNRASASASSEIESEARRNADQIQKDVEQIAENMANQFAELFKAFNIN